MNNERWEVAEFCIRSEKLTVEEISQILGLAPSISYNKGELLSKRNPKSKLRTETLWTIKENLINKTLNEQIFSLLEKLETRKDKLELLKDKASFEFYCGFSSSSGQGGLLLDNLILKNIVEINASIFLDLYPPETHKE